MLVPPSVKCTTGVLLFKLLRFLFTVKRKRTKLFGSEAYYKIEFQYAMYQLIRIVWQTSPTVIQQHLRNKFLSENIITEIRYSSCQEAKTGTRYVQIY